MSVAGVKSSMERYHKDLGPDPITYTKSVNTVGLGLVIESTSPSEDTCGLDAYWGASKE